MEDINEPSLPQFPFWSLPDAVLFHIVSFVAPPTCRATVLCHQIAPLCRAARRTVLPRGDGHSIWDIVFQQDYESQNEKPSKRRTSSPRRKSKRLQQRTSLQRVKLAIESIRRNTDTAFFHLSEMSRGQGSCLSVAKLRQVLRQSCPLRLNQVNRTGGVFLVEVCRARHVSETTVLHGVQELVDRHGAAVNLQTYESPSSYETALCVAATRGMPTVVRYLLQKGADPGIRCAGRFRSAGRTTLCRSDVTALEFATAMYQHEQSSASTQDDSSLRDLGACIQQLQKEVKQRYSRTD